MVFGRDLVSKIVLKVLLNFVSGTGFVLVLLWQAPHQVRHLKSFVGGAGKGTKL